MERLDNCPNCSVSLIGDPIPEKYLHHNIPGDPFYNEKEPTCEESQARSRKFDEDWNSRYPSMARPVQDRCFCLPYGDSTHWRREIGVEIRGLYDGVLFWKCPDCGWAWARWTDGGRLTDQAAAYVRRNNDELSLDA